MGVALGGIIGAAALSAGAGVYGTSATNRANQSMSKSTRKWQEYMDNTKYQRTVGDLKAAGLNPMLAYSQGAGSPPGTQAPVMQNELAGVGDAINSAVTNYRTTLEAKNLKELNDKIKADTDASRATADKARADAAVSAAMVPKIQADTVGSTNSAAYTVAQTKAVDFQVQKVLAETQNIKDENARIKASVDKLLAETRNLPLTGDQIKHAIDLMTMQIEGMDLDQIRKLFEMPGIMNRSKSEGTWWGEKVRPFLPDFKDIMSGANSARGAIGR